MRNGDLSGWFVRALITPRGLDRLTDTLTHARTARYFCSETMLHSVCILCAVCVTALRAWFVHTDGCSRECVKESL